VYMYMESYRKSQIMKMPINIKFLDNPEYIMSKFMHIGVFSGNPFINKQNLRNDWNIQAVTICKSNHKALQYDIFWKEINLWYLMYCLWLNTFYLKHSLYRHVTSKHCKIINVNQNEGKSTTHTTYFWRYLLKFETFFISSL
jgi:hypothetical protein